MDDFEDYAIYIDSELYDRDFDDIDLFGEKLVEDSDDNFGDEIDFG